MITTWVKSKSKRAMKKYLILASAALVALAACNKEPVEAPVLPDETVSALTFTSTRPQLDDVTRTAWDSETSSVVWQATDKIKVGFTFNDAWWAQTEAYSSENISPNNHVKFYLSDEVTIDDNSGNVGTFVVPTGNGKFTGPTTAGDFVFYAVYPGVLVDNSLDTAPSATVTLKTSQSPASNSFDATTDVMVATSDVIESTGLPTDPIELNWNRVVAHTNLTFSNMAFVGTEVPNKITLTFNEEAKVAGDFSVNIADGTIGSGSANEIVLEGSGLSASDNSIITWATVLPVSFTSLNVEIKTDKATYVRSITGLNKTFQKNARNRLTINMAMASRSASEQFDWVKKDLSQISSSDVFVIVGNNGSNYAMSNNNGTGSAPSAVAVTVTNNKLSIAPAENIQWTLSGNATDGYTFYPSGTTETWLYCTNTNNGVRVGTNDAKFFVLDAESGYIKHVGTSRFLGIYATTPDWRCYTTSTTNTNIKDQTFAFYVRSASTPSKPVPTISFGTPTTEVNIGETVTNVATIDPSNLEITYSSSDDEVATVSATGVVTGVAAGTATITAAFAGDETYDEASAEYEITVIDPNSNDGSEAKPYTASEAIAVAEHLGTETRDVYVKGIVCTTGSVNTTYNSVTYYISDDGSTTSRLQIYSGKYIAGANFTEENNLKLGDYVVVYGTLKYYNNSTPEIDKNSEIQSVFRAPTFSPNGGSFDTASTTVEISAESGATIRYTIDGNNPTSTSGSVYNGAITITETTTVKAIAIKDNIATGVSSATFTKTTSSDVLYSLYSGDLTEGDYVIVYNGKAMKNTVSSNRLGYAEVTVSGNDIANPDASIVWHIASSGDYWTIYNAAVLKYAAGNGTKNQGALEDSVNDKSLWSASGSSTYEFVNKNNAASNVNANLRNNGTYGFACYGTGTGGALSLYKKN